MDRENVNYKTSGFLKDAKYTAALPQYLDKYKDKFGDAESLTVYIDEVIPSQMQYLKEEPIQISKDGKEVKIKLTFFQYRNQKGKITSKPDSIDVYQQLSFILNKAVIEYADKFSST